MGTYKSNKKSSRAKGKTSKADQRQENREVLGLILITVGVLLGLTIYTSTTGIVGKFFEENSGRIFGLARYLIPPFIVFWGWQVIRSRDAKQNKIIIKPSSLIAWICLFIGAFSLLDLIGGRPSWNSSAEELSQAGGWLGVNFGGTFERYFGDAGQVVLTLGLFAIAATLLTSVSMGEAADVVAGKFQPVRDWLVSVFSNIGWVESEEEETKKKPKKYKKVFEGDDEIKDQEDDDEYIDLTDPDALEKVTNWSNEVKDPVIEIPQQRDVSGMEVSQLRPQDGTWDLPDLDLLDRSEVQSVDQSSVEATGRTLEHALAEHGVETRLIGIVVGPTVSRFELELGPGVKVQKVLSLHKDIAYSMATPDVRIMAPIPGKQAIGVEVPNVRRQVITVGDLLVSPEAVAADHPLEVVLGRDINGRTVMINLAEMPHLLVAGQTGSGKSSCINSLLTSVLMRSTPEQVRLILVDPKRVELTQYRKLPHLLTDVVTDPKKAANALSWAVKEMERRYDILSEYGARDITGFNNSIQESEDSGADDIPEKMGFILIIIDELADLMMVAARDVEESICRVAQKARAVGIHLVIATQRPSTNVITGLIKANIPARLAFAVSSLTDSRVILDQSGAEKLVGKGDALLNDGRSSAALRYQGAWVTEAEVSSVVKSWINQAPNLVYDSGVVGEDPKQEQLVGIMGGSSGDEEDDELMLKAIDLVVRSQLGSTSMLQRKLRIGFARAGRIMDLLEERGVVGPSVGSKAREVLVTKQELESGAWSSLGATNKRSEDHGLNSLQTNTSSSQIIEDKPRRKTLSDIPNPEPLVTRKPKYQQDEEPIEIIKNETGEDSELYSDDDHLELEDFEVEDENLFDEEETDPALAPPPGYND